MEQLTVPSKCTNCQAKLDVPIVCGACNALFPVAVEVDHFRLLGLPNRFDLDEATLRSAYRAIARYVHPDRFAGQGGDVTTLATRLAAELHTAVDVLSDPVRRAGYMLERAGGPTAAQERGVPGNLLMEVMEIREVFEKGRERSDETALEVQREKVRSRRDEILNRIALTADRLDEASDDEKRRMRQDINAIKYFENLLRDFSSDPFAAGSKSRR
jgi:molecular chaperone HscB